MIQRAVIAGLDVDRRARRRPARLAVGRDPARAEDAGPRRRRPRRAERARSRAGADPDLRVAGDPAHGRRCRRRSRSTSPARSCDARRSTRSGQTTYPDARARELRRRTSSTRSTPRRSARAASVSPSTSATRRRRSSSRSSSARWGSTPSPPTASSTRRGPSAHRWRSPVDYARRLVTAVAADLGVVFDRAGERLFLVDEHGESVPRRDDALALRASPGRSRQDGDDRRSGDRDEPGRPPRRGQRPRGRADDALAQRPHACSRAERTSSSPARSEAATCSPTSFPATTRWRASASCSSCSYPQNALCPSSSPSCHSRPSSTARCRARGLARGS